MIVIFIFLGNTGFLCYIHKNVCCSFMGFVVIVEQFMFYLHQLLYKNWVSGKLTM